jgi:NAD(P)-dependent dehydrogenase (short-subunit alcohol dehydrogenase family)
LGEVDTGSVDSTAPKRPFDATSTAADVMNGIDLRGRQAIVTGANSGIGIETARALALAGAEVTMAVRNVDNAAGTVEAIRAAASDHGGSVDARKLDLADLRSVDAFVADWSGPLHILINNAGVMALPELTRSAAGWDMQFATNHLGHFALTVGLHGALASAGGARVVSVSSIGHLFSPVVFDDLHYRFRPYDPWTSYGQSKCANALMAVGISHRWVDEGVAANAAMPGNVGETGLIRHIPQDVLAAIASGSGGFALPAPKTVEQGAATSLFLAASPLTAGVTGRYFEDCQEAHTVSERAQNTSGVAAYAVDPDNADRLWAVSETLIAAAR